MRQFIVLTLATILLSACGTTQGLTSADLNKPIEKGNVRVIMERDESLMYVAAGANIRINGLKVATLGRGGAVTRDVKAGTVTLEASATSAPGQFVVRFNALPRQTYHFTISPKSDALLTGSAFGLVGDTIHASISDTSGYFQIDLKDAR